MSVLSLNDVAWCYGTSAVCVKAEGCTLRLTADELLGSGHMPEMPLHIRRCRRTDFVAVMRLLADGGAPAAVPDRGTLRRFRGLVNDLGADFYLALVDDALAGLVHVTYARQLAAAPCARIESLVVGESFRRHGIGAALLDFVKRRAIRRGCGTLTCSVGSGGALLENAGMRPEGQLFVQELKP